MWHQCTTATRGSLSINKVSSCASVWQTLSTGTVKCYPFPNKTCRSRNYRQNYFPDWSGRYKPFHCRKRKRSLNLTKSKKAIYWRWIGTSLEFEIWYFLITYPAKNVVFVVSSGKFSPLYPWESLYGYLWKDPL